jgi:hypothetical protein
MLGSLGEKLLKWCYCCVGTVSEGKCSPESRYGTTPTKSTEELGTEVMREDVLTNQMRGAMRLDENKGACNEAGTMGRQRIPRCTQTWNMIVAHG